MQPIAYTISPYLIRYLDRIEALRQQIILYPLAPNRLLGMQFQATIDRVHFGLALTEIHVLPEKIETVLANQIAFSMQKSAQHKDVIQNNTLRYKQALDYIKRDWLLSANPINVKTFLDLASLTGITKDIVSEKQISDIATYLLANNDSSFTQAALAKLLLRGMVEDTTKTELFSTMASYLFLYHAGMDCRGLLILEKSWALERKLFDGYYATSHAKPQVTNWLEYFVKTVCKELEQLYQSLAMSKTKITEEKIGDLNERQKVIMTLLDDPQAIITNRTIQKIFHISAITASRDLAKLTMLGLLIPRGKGRSVRYTRV